MKHPSSMLAMKCIKNRKSLVGSVCKEIQVVSNSLRVVDFAIGLLNAVLNLHNTRQMNFLR